VTALFQFGQKSIHKGRPFIGTNGDLHGENLSRKTDGETSLSVIEIERKAVVRNMGYSYIFLLLGRELFKNG
jgi:hypothetical protein